LKELVEEHLQKIDFVVIGSCHSEFAVKIFKDAGVKHVIGIKSEYEIRDDAVIVFTEAFYKSVWQRGSKVC
jgi:hypothetical protein